MESRILTKNQMGWAIEPDDDYINEFIQYSQQVSGYSMDIGAAYGFATLKAVEGGAHIIVNDICKEHLDYIKKNIKARYKHLISYMEGNFLSFSIQENSIESILLSRVLHMLSAKELEKAIDLIWLWLKTNGRAFITVATPYTKNLEKFVPIFRKNKSLGIDNPGLISNLDSFLSDTNKNLPKKMQLFDLDILISTFQKRGFSIIKAGYIKRTDQENICKFSPYTDSCGVVVIKP